MQALRYLHSCFVLLYKFDVEHLILHYGHNRSFMNDSSIISSGYSKHIDTMQYAPLTWAMWELAGLVIRDRVADWVGREWGPQSGPSNIPLQPGSSLITAALRQVVMVPRRPIRSSKCGSD